MYTKQSQLFTKTQRNAPSDEVWRNAELLIRAGYIHKVTSGVYTLLPFGLRVVQKIADIIRQEMNAVGGIEMQSSALQIAEPWEATGRWSDEVVDNWFKTELKNGTSLRLAFTHEEPMTALMKHHIASYKDLPVYVYDIRSVFRNEARAKSGIMRGREFFWKALYSFSKNKEEHDEFYERISQAYMNIFHRVGIGDKTYKTFASGGTFAKYSHEFQTVCEVGEDTIYIDEVTGIALNEEVLNGEVLSDLGLSQDKLVSKKAVEVGNIFSLGYRFSDPIGLLYTDERGEKIPVYMGSYGIGITRLLGVIVELLSDEKGIVMPASIAPYEYHIIALGNTVNEAYEYASRLDSRGYSVLVDDRNASAGEKFADADLIGIPVRIVVSEKTLSMGGVEIKKRTEKEAIIVQKEDFLVSVSRCKQ